MKREHNAFNLKRISYEKPALAVLAGKHELDLLILLGSYGTRYFQPGRRTLILPFFPERNCSRMNICS